MKKFSPFIFLLIMGAQLYSQQLSLDNAVLTARDASFSSDDAFSRGNFVLIDAVISASAGTNGTIYPNGNTTVPPGGNQAYTITPNANYRIADVLVDGVSNASAINTGTYTFTNVNEAHTISATFVFNNTYTVTASAGSNGSITPSGDIAVASGGNQTFTITANTGYHINNVLVDGVNNPAAVNSGTYTFTNVTAPHTISVTFAINTYTITASAGPNGTISSPGATQVNYNAGKSYTITPNGGYYVGDVVVDGVSQGRRVYYDFLNVTSDHTISASFVPVPQAPAIQWQKALGGTGSDASTCIHQTSDGGFIVGGSTGSNDGDVTGNHGGSDIWIVKLTANGTISWQKTYGGTAGESICNIWQTADGGYVIGGGTGSTDGDVSGNHGSSDAWVVKLDNVGGIVWQKCYGGTGGDAVNSFEKTMDGGFIIAGNSISTDGDLAGVGQGGGWILKISSNGTKQWVKGYTAGTATSSIIGCISQTSDSGYIIGARTDLYNVQKFKIMRLDAAGNTLWETVTNHYNFPDDFVRYETPPVSVCQTPDGGYALFMTGYQGIFYELVKFNAAGTELWDKIYGGGSYHMAGSMRLTSDGGFILNGNTNSSNGDVWPPVHSFTDDYWVVKLNSNGDIQWQKPLGGSNTDFGLWAEETADGGYAVAGYVQSTDGDITGAHGSGSDIWVVKLTAATTYTITSSATAGGSITPNGNTVVNQGGNQTYTFTPSTGYHIADVLVDGVSNAGAVNSGAYTFSNVTAAHTISVSFAINTYSIGSSAGPHGSISPLGNTVANYGSSVTYTITLGAGYVIMELLVDSVAMANPQTTYSFNNISANHTIRATFTNHDSATVTMCPPVDSTNITSNITGISYRWQLNNGNGFANLSDNSLYSGTSTATLKLRNFSSSRYGFKYRCIVDGASSLEYIMKVKDTWIGGFDDNWETAANWSCGTVPDANTDVVIPAGAAVLVNSNVIVRSLSAAAGANITVLPGYNLTVLH